MYDKAALENFNFVSSFNLISGEIKKNGAKLQNKLSWWIKNNSIYTAKVWTHMFKKKILYHFILHKIHYLYDIFIINQIENVNKAKLAFFSFIKDAYLKKIKHTCYLTL